MKKAIKYFSILLASFIGLLLILYIGASIYLRLNKKEIIAKIAKTVESKFQSTVTIEDLDIALFQNFPNLSLEVKNLDVKGPMFHIHGKKLFTASRLYISIASHKLLIGKVSVRKTSFKNGNLFIYTDSTGLSNFSYFSSTNKKAKNNQPLDLPSNIEFVNVDLTIQDVYREKYFSFLLNKLLLKTNSVEGGDQIKLDQDILVKSLAFNLKNGSFLENKSLVGKYKILLSKNFTGIEFNKIEIAISKQPFVFTGKFHFGDAGYFNLDIQTNKIGFPFAKSLLTKHIAKALNIVEIDAPLNVHTTLAGSLNGGDPLVLAKWEVKNAVLVTPLVNFKKSNFSGYFSNEVVKGLPRKDPNSKIHIDSLSAEWEGIPVKASKIEVINLSVPKVIGSFNSNFELSSFNNILNSEAIEFSEGLGNVKVDYDGPLNRINNNNAKIHIQFMLNRGTIAVKPMGIKLSECLTDLSIQNSDLVLHSMVAKGNKGSVINLWGNATNIFSFLENVPGKATVNLNMYSPFLNMTNLASFLSHTKRVAVKHTKTTLSKSIHKLDHILESGTISVNMKTDKIAYNQLLATAFKSSIQLQEGNWNLNELQFNLAGGSFNIKADIKNRVNNQHPITARFNIKNMEASSFFYAFSDFGSKTFGHKNISGLLNASGNLNGTMNAAGDLNKKTLNAKLSFSLKNGSLKKVDALEKIQEHVFKNRNFSDVRFAELKNTVVANNGMVNIPRMQIESSVFGLFLEGQYGLAGNTDLRIQVPLRNLSSNNSSNKPILTEKNAKGGMSIFLRAKSGEDGKLSIGLDALGRFRKSNLGDSTNY
ncbi:MAG: AsmA-like C-terminal region-containing protein [Sediminibacterium sp.]|nr:AsmA-like C-terminal region-containing protein [Sediminibacterium sp.]